MGYLKRILVQTAVDLIGHVEGLLVVFLCKIALQVFRPERNELREIERLCSRHQPVGELLFAVERNVLKSELRLGVDPHGIVLSARAHVI